MKFTAIWILNVLADTTRLMEKQKLWAKTRACGASLCAHVRSHAILRNTLLSGGGGGTGEIFDSKILAQQKCAKSCRSILRSVAIFQGVIFSALEVHIPLVPAHFALQGRFGRHQSSRK